MRKITSWAAFVLVSAGLGAAAVAGQSDQKSQSQSNPSGQQSPSTQQNQGMQQNPSAQGEEGAGASNAPSRSSRESCRLDDTARLNIVLSQLHAANQEEIQSGKTAADKAQTQAVKDFANRMVTEHTSADQNLTDLARKQNIKLGQVKSNDPVSMALTNLISSHPKDLKDVSGPSFDAVYMGGQPMEHELVLDIIEQGQKSASNADVKKLLDDAHKMVSSHHEEALRINRDFRLTGAAVGGGPTTGQGQEMNAPPSESERHDGGVYPPSTTPPDLQHQQQNQKERSH